MFCIEYSILLLLLHKLYGILLLDIINAKELKIFHNIGIYKNQLKQSQCTIFTFEKFQTLHNIIFLDFKVHYLIQIKDFLFFKYCISSKHWWKSCLKFRVWTLTWNQQLLLWTFSNFVFYHNVSVDKTLAFKENQWIHQPKYSHKHNKD